MLTKIVKAFIMEIIEHCQEKLITSKYFNAISCLGQGIGLTHLHTHLILTMTRCGIDYHHSHLIDEEAKAKNG